VAGGRRAAAKARRSGVAPAGAKAVAGALAAEADKLEGAKTGLCR